MTKIIFDSLSYREGKPSANELGFTSLNFCNRGFYGLDSNGQISYDIPPNPSDINNTAASLPADEAIYFDLEPWLCLPDDATEYDKLRKKMYSVKLIEKFRSLNPSFSKYLGIFGLPDGNMYPGNPLVAIEAWRNKNRRLMSGEIWNLLYSRINCLMPCFYPYDYGNGNSTLTNQIQLQYNQLSLDITRELNTNNYPIFAFWQPRLKKSDGSRPFMTYSDSVIQLDWILKRCDGVVLWDWDGQIDPQTGDIATWDDDAPWLKAVKDVQRTYNTPPKFETVNKNSLTPFNRKING